MKTKILIAFLAFAKIASAQTWVTIPDANFVHYLDSLIPAAMNGNQMNTSSSLVTTTTHSISIPNKGIADLTGLQYFTSLTRLECWSNPIYPPINTFTIMPALPNTLVYLDCQGHHLTSLPNLPNTLSQLYCSNGRLTSLPALPNSLTWLECDNNFLTTLPTLPNSLVELTCPNNKITCFPPFPNSITGMIINSNSFTCLPNYIPAMGSDTVTYPLCAAGNPNGCAVAGIEKYSSNNIQLTVYPNPASTTLNVSFTKNTESSSSIELIDLIGQTVYAKTLNKNISANEVINIGELAKGIYMLILIDDNNTVTKKIIVE